jgi:hypothetical protein
VIGLVSDECAFCWSELALREAATHGPAATPVFWSGTRPSYAELNAA